MAKKLILGLILAHVGPNFVSKNFFRFYFYSMLNIVEMNQTWKNGKKTDFQPDFGPTGPNLGPNNFSWILPQLDARHYKLSLYSISRKTNEPNFRKWQKNPNFWAWFWSVLAQIWTQNIFWCYALLEVIIECNFKEN